MNIQKLWINWIDTVFSMHSIYPHYGQTALENTFYAVFWYKPEAKVSSTQDKTKFYTAAGFAGRHELVGNLIYFCSICS
jgi:hypothetical protein